MTETNCRTFESRIDQHLRSELGEEETADFERHLRSCEECASIFKQHLEMTCRRFVDVIADFLEGTLGKDDSEVFSRHIEVCPDCKTYLENYRLTVDSLREPDEIPAPPADLVRALLNARPNDPRSSP